MLLEVDHTRPKQVNLRRAVSAAYYAVFHLLISEASKRVVGTGAGQVHDRLRAEVGRWFGHNEMKRVCEWFGSSGKVPAHVARLLGYPKPGIVPAKLTALCDTFISLQEDRHRADYDVTYSPTRISVMLSVEEAKLAFEHVATVRGDPAYNLFLTLLLTGDRVVKTR